MAFLQGGVPGNVVASDGSSTLTGNLDMGTNRIINLADPVDPQDATTKAWVSAQGFVTAEADPLSLALAGGNSPSAAISWGNQALNDLASVEWDNGVEDAVLSSPSTGTTGIADDPFGIPAADGLLFEGKVAATSTAFSFANADSDSSDEIFFDIYSDGKPSSANSSMMRTTFVADPLAAAAGSPDGLWILGPSPKGTGKVGLFVVGHKHLVAPATADDEGARIEMQPPTNFNTGTATGQMFLQSPTNVDGQVAAGGWRCSPTEFAPRGSTTLGQDSNPWVEAVISEARSADNATADAAAASSMAVSGGDKTAGTGDGGALNLSGGSSAGGSAGQINCNSPTKLGSQIYAPSAGGTSIYPAGAGNSVQMQIHSHPDNIATEAIDQRFQIYGLGDGNASPVNKQYAQLEWDASNDRYELTTQAEGAGVVKDLGFSASSGGGWLLLSASNGDVRTSKQIVANTTLRNGLVINGATSAIELEDQNTGDAAAAPTFEIRGSDQISAAGTGNAGTLSLEAGDASGAASGNGGNILLFAGSTTAGSEGTIELRSGSNVKRIVADGTGLGFFDTTPVAQPSAFTQTYATASKTHAAPTAVTLTDSSGGTADNTVQALTDPADAPATADALRDDLVANLIPELRNNYAELADEVNKLIADLANVKQVLNAAIDDDQALGLKQ